MLICFLVDDKSRAVYAKGSAERLEYCVRDRIVPLVMCLVSQGFVRSLLGNSPQHLVNVAGLLSFVNQDSVNIAIWLCQLVRDTHVVVSFDVCFLQFFNVSAEYAKAQLLLRYPNEKRRHAEVPGLLCCDAVWLETESWMGELARAVSRWLLRLQPISSFFISVVAAAATAGHYTRAPSCRTRCAFCASGSGAGVSWKRSCDLCSGVRRRPAVLRPAIGQVWFARPLIGFFFGLSWCFCLSVLLWLASRACKSAAEWLLL